MGPTEELNSWAAATMTITGHPGTKSSPKAAIMSLESRAVTRNTARAPVNVQRETSRYR